MSGRAIVVGAGITGVAAALSLQRSGWGVMLVDRVAPGDPAQTSYGNAGLLARAAVVPVSTPGLIWRAPRLLFDPNAPLFLRWRYLPRLMPWLVPFLRNGASARVARIAQTLAGLTGDAVARHQALAAGTNAARFIRTGDYVYLYPDRSAARKDRAGFALRRANGFAVEERTQAALSAADPALGPGARFGIALPDHGWITDPGAYLAELAQVFSGQGGAFQQGEAVSLAPGQVTLAGGQVLAADRIVLTAGAWSGALAQSLGLKMPLESERGYHLMLRGTNIRPPHPYMVATGSFAVTPMEGGMRLAGIVEFGGLHAPPSRAPFALLRRAIRRVYPDLTWTQAEEWMGHRPSLPDSLPVLGEDPRRPGIIHAYGGQHVGLTMGPLLGKLAADIATGARPNRDLAALAPTRFSGAR
ncbi:MAG: FAD-binding oxidoreductase [Pseudomonadota bacterium]